jgi:hypothetical protein
VADWIAQEAQQKAMEAAVVFLEKAKTVGWGPAVQELPSTASPGQTPLFRRLSLFEAGVPIIYSDVQTLLKNYAVLAWPGQIGPDPIPVINPTPKGFLAVSLAKLEPADEADVDKPGGFSSRGTQDRLMDAFYGYWLAQANQEVDLKLPNEVRSLIDGQS